MIARLLYRLTANRPCRLIKQPDGSPYLERYFLFQLFGWTCYLHRFVGSDGDRSLHNHPWRFAFSILFTGWYQEWRGKQTDCWIVADLDADVVQLNKVKLRKVSRINLITRHTFHQIAVIKPNTWTLFLHTGWRWRWGFLSNSIGRYLTAGDAYFYRDYPGSFTKDKAWWNEPSCPTGNTANREPFSPK